VAGHPSEGAGNGGCRGYCDAPGPLIAVAPDRIPGPSASARFGGRLPYLFKVFDVASMLSIQVHPTKEQAGDGCARENAAGIDLGAAEGRTELQG
jgi:mannose-6-phosphate isomerase class I